MSGGGHRPLVALHGFLGCAGDFDTLFAAVGGARPCCAVELPGHGAQPPPPEVDPLGDLASRIAETIEPLGDVDYLGYSMGGRMLYQLLGDPRLGRWRHLVLVSAHPGLASDAERADRVLADDWIAQRLETGSPDDFEAFLDDWYAKPLFGRIREADGYAAMRARRREADPAGLALALRRLGAGRFKRRLEALRGAGDRVLLIAGAKDAKYAALNAEVADAVRGVRAVTIEGAAHAPHVEQPAAFADVVRAFLDGSLS